LCWFCLSVRFKTKKSKFQSNPNQSFIGIEPETSQLLANQAFFNQPV